MRAPTCRAQEDRIGRGSLHQDVEVVSKDLLSKLQDIDYTQAISQLDMQTFVLQAAQQSYAKISGLSLFNSL